MQRKRYGEKRKGGYVDMGKQVRYVMPYLLRANFNMSLGSSSRACTQNHQRSR